MASGATLALRRRFSASGFLADVRAVGATYFNTVGRAISHIVATPPTEHDQDHRLRFVLGPETSAPDKAAFTRRFGVPLFEGYGSSENAIVLQPVPDARPGALGRASTRRRRRRGRPGTGVERPPAVFDAERPPDQRRARPSASWWAGRRWRNFEGYYNNPEAEAERTRNGWYWSGDLGLPRRGRGSSTSPGAPATGSGWTARTSPPPRWSGSSAGSPACAGWPCTPCPTPAPATRSWRPWRWSPEAGFDPVAFAAFLAAQPDLGTKWAPRYVRIVGALPVTATDKVDKRPLRAELWNTPDPVWHRVGPGRRLRAR